MNGQSHERLFIGARSLAWGGLGVAISYLVMTKVYGLGPGQSLVYIGLAAVIMVPAVLVGLGRLGSDVQVRAPSAPAALLLLAACALSMLSVVLILGDAVLGGGLAGGAAVVLLLASRDPSS